MKPETVATQRRMLRAPEAAEYLSLSTSTLAKMRLAGNGPRFIKWARRVAYDPADLEKWLADKRRSSTSDKGGAL